MTEVDNPKQANGVYVPPHLRANKGGAARSGQRREAPQGDTTNESTASTTGNNSNRDRSGSAFSNNQFNNRDRAPRSFNNNRTGDSEHFGQRERSNVGASSSAIPKTGVEAWLNRDGKRRVMHSDTRFFSRTTEDPEEAEAAPTVGADAINFDLYDSISVEVKGTGSEEFKPMEMFDAIKGEIAPEVHANVVKAKYVKPTPVQKYGLPIILKGRDLMACAQTGSGKTAAFLIPVITSMLQQGPPPTPEAFASSRYSSNLKKYPVTLIMSPTRELAMQIHEQALIFSENTGIRSVVLYGGANVSQQRSELMRGCDICVATPGRLTDFLERGWLSLQCVRHLVLDEADRMLDMGFMPQVTAIVEEFDMPSSANGRQTIMFSATFPKEIQQFAVCFLIDYIYLCVGIVGSTNALITQKFIYADEREKPKRLCQYLRELTEGGLVLVFVETKRKADLLVNFLYQEGFRAISIHGDRTQAERTYALQQFKSGKCSYLVATDLAARGLDITNVTNVINCDLPGNIQDYVHRIGRTGRAGHHGCATSFINDSAKNIIKDLTQLLQDADQVVPPWFSTISQSAHGSYGSKGGYNSGYGGGGGYNNRQVDTRGGNRGGYDRGSMNKSYGGQNQSYGGYNNRNHQQQDDGQADCW